MRGSLGLVAEHYARKASSVFSALSGMMAAALVPGASSTAAARPIEYLYTAIMFTVTIGLGMLTVRAAKGATVRWTVMEMSAFFAIGVIAMLAFAYYL